MLVAQIPNGFSWTVEYTLCPSLTSYPFLDVYSIDLVPLPGQTVSLTSTAVPGSTVLTGVYALSLDGAAWTAPISTAASETDIASALSTLPGLQQVCVYWCEHCM